MTYRRRLHQRQKSATESRNTGVILKNKVERFNDSYCVFSYIHTIIYHLCVYVSLVIFTMLC